MTRGNSMATLLPIFLIGQRWSKHGRQHVSHTTVHILVNNTGGPPAGPITDASPDVFLRYFEQHIAVNQVLAVACLDGMKAAGLWQDHQYCFHIRQDTH
jgi:hypothetical protein